MKEKVLESIEELLRTNASEDFSVQHLTLLTGMNKNQLMKLFKTVYGVTIHQYVIQQRIEMARQLLITTDEPIKAIAVNTGFGNEKYFITLFKKTFLLTPGVYRRQHKA